MPNRALTLIELLILVAIFGVLSTIAVPAIGFVRERARSAVCKSNLRDWHAAMLAHAEDNNDILVAMRYSTVQHPGTRQFWAGHLAYYLDLEPAYWSRQSPWVHGTAAECPSVAWRDTSTYISYAANGSSLMSHAFLMWDTDGARRVQAVMPRTIVFGDQGPTYDQRWVVLNRSRASAGALAYRHADHANVIMMDGSVESFHSVDNVELNDDLWFFNR
jgi:prepilin-type processing-associated H-X9-DG protein